MAIATKNGVAWASIATLNGIAKASVATINGVSTAGGGGNTFGVQLAGPAANTQTGVASIASTFGGSTPIGSLTVAFITQTFGANAPKTISSVADNVDGGNLTLRSETNNGGNLYVHIYSRVATAAGTRPSQCNFSGGNADATIAVMSYSATGGFTSDVTSANTGTGTSITPGSVSPTGTALYLAVAVWVNGNGAAFTATGGWTPRQELESGSSSLIGVQELLNGSGAQNPAMAIDQSLTWAAAIATYH